MRLALLTGRQQFETVLIGGFSGIVLLFTSLGFDSMLATMLTSRTREIGLRMAIGANPGDVAWIVLVRSSLLLVSGAALGTLGAAVA